MEFMKHHNSNFVKKFNLGVWPVYLGRDIGRFFYHWIIATKDRRETEKMSSKTVPNAYMIVTKALWVFLSMPFIEIIQR